MNASFWSKQKVLVTGGGGFLGSHLCKRLLKEGAEVHATSRSERAQLDSEPHWWRRDLSDLGATQDLMAALKPDVVYHLAGSVSAQPNLELVLPTFYSLLASTINLLTVASEMSCRRVILCGSLTEPRSDHGVETPSSPYAAAKWAASGYARMFQALYGTPTVILRTFMTYGPRQDVRKLIPSVILAILRGESPELSSGQWQADWIYVDDVIEGFLAAGERPSIEGSTIDLGCGSLISVRALIEELITIMKPSVGPQFGALPDRPMEPVLMANIKAAKEKLGWRPHTPLHVGLSRTIDWYRSYSSSIRSNFQNSEHSPTSASLYNS